MAFNYEGAKKAGFNDAQIGEYMRLKGVSAAPKKSVAGFAGNVVKSGIKAATDLGGAVINTVNPDMKKNTIANLGRVGIGAAQLLVPGEQGMEDNARAVGSFYKDRYGSIDKIKNTLYTDPVGAGLDVATVATGAGGLLKGAGSLSKISGLTKAGNAFSKAASFTDPFSMASRGVSKAASTGRAKLASGLTRASDDIVTRGIGNPAAQAKMAQKGGRSVASFIDEYDLYDRSPETARQAKRTILNQYDDLALNSGKSVEMSQIMKAFDAEIQRLSQGVGGVISDANQAKITELIRRRDQLLQASGGTVDDAGRLTSSPIQAGVDTLTNFRRNVIDPDVPQSMFNLDARGSGAAQGVKQARDIVKGAIDSSDPRLGKLGKDYGMAKGMEKILTNAEARGNNRQVFNFTKMGGAGLGGVVAGAPAALGGFAVETVANHPRFIAGASKAMRAGGKALGNHRLDNLSLMMGRIIQPVENYARMGRTANLSQNQKTPISTNSQRQLPPLSEMSKLPPYSSPRSGQAFGGTSRVPRGSFY